MKTLLIALCFLLFCSSIFAQEEITEKRVKEAGVIFTNLNNFGLTYRIGNAKNVWRFNTAFISGGQSDIFGSINGSGNYNRSLGFGLQAGREFRNRINDNFELRSGTDLMFQYDRFENKYDPSPFTSEERKVIRNNYSIGVSFVLGINYIIKKQLVIGAEIQPFISYNELKNKEENTYFNGTNYVTEEFSNNINTINFGINNQSAILSIAYRY